MYVSLRHYTLLPLALIKSYPTHCSHTHTVFPESVSYRDAPASIHRQTSPIHPPLIYTQIPNRQTSSIHPPFIYPLAINLWQARSVYIHPGGRPAAALKTLTLVTTARYSPPHSSQDHAELRLDKALEALAPVPYSRGKKQFVRPSIHPVWKRICPA